MEKRENRGTKTYVFPIQIWQLKNLVEDAIIQVPKEYLNFFPLFPCIRGLKLDGLNRKLISLTIYNI